MDLHLTTTIGWFLLLSMVSRENLAHQMQIYWGSFMGQSYDVKCCLEFRNWTIAQAWDELLWAHLSPVRWIRSNSTELNRRQAWTYCVVYIDKSRNEGPIPFICLKIVKFSGDSGDILEGRKTNIFGTSVWNSFAMGSPERRRCSFGQQRYPEKSMHWFADRDRIVPALSESNCYRSGICEAPHRKESSHHRTTPSAFDDRIPLPDDIDLPMLQFGMRNLYQLGCLMSGWRIPCLCSGLDRRSVAGNETREERPCDQRIVVAAEKLCVRTRKSSKYDLLRGNGQQYLSWRIPSQMWPGGLSPQKRCSESTTIVVQGDWTGGKGYRTSEPILCDATELSEFDLGIKWQFDAILCDCSFRLPRALDRWMICEKLHRTSYTLLPTGDERWRHEELCRGNDTNRD